jgi:hypothetical protein
MTVAESWDDGDLVFPSTAAHLHLQPFSSDDNTSNSSSSARSISNGRRDSWGNMDLDLPGTDTTLDGDEEMASTIKARNPLLNVPKVAAGDSQQYSGTVTMLGSYATKTVDGDWDEDVSFPKDGLGLPSVRPKASFSSQILDDTSEDDTFRPRTKAKLSSSSVESEADADFGSDFDLPDTLSRVSLSPVLARTRSAAGFDRPVTPSRPPTASASSPQSRLCPPRLGARSSTSSMSPQSSDEPADDLFDDLVLPPFFGGPGVVTPPLSAKGKGKVTLQDILETKLQARLRSGHRTDGVHRHWNTFDEHEEGLVIDDTVEWARVKPSGSIRHEQAATRTKSRQGRADRGNTLKGSTPSRRDFQTSPLSQARRSPSDVVQQPISPISPATTRPNGPRPPRPPLNSRARLTETNTGLGRPVSASSARTPVNPSRTLKYKKSTSMLQSGASPRTLSHKRSLPSLSDAGSNLGVPSSPSVVNPRFPSSSQRPLPNTPRAATASYAQPTLASQNRRQAPSTPTTANPLRRYGHLQESPPVPPARPSTPASGSAVRITVPTLSSRLKQRAPVSTASDPFGRAFASLGRPVTPSTSPTSATKASSKVLRNPKRQRQYGDGTELDGFDDLPTNKEKERRFIKDVPDGATVRRTGVSKDMKKALREPRKKKDASPSSKQRNQPQLIRNLTAAGLAKGKLTSCLA